MRVNLTGADTLQNRHDVLVRFMQAYKETVDWMYSSPEALKIYGEYSGLPDNIVQRVIKLMPKEALQTDEVKGIDEHHGRRGDAKIPVRAADAGSAQGIDPDSEVA